MSPTLLAGDHVIVNKISRIWSEPRPHSIVAFRPPKEAKQILMPHMKGKRYQAFVKRIVAIEGDLIEVVDGKLWVNNELIEEDYVDQAGAYSWGPHIIPKGMVAVLGDNRQISLDSHIWGFLEKDQIIGKLIGICWPINRARLTITQKK